MIPTPPVLTPDAILALATDAGSAANARKLATPGRWPVLNAVAGALWGQCQGSGQEPYLTGVDLSGPVGKCSCPSRKFPCKHVLALLLLRATQPGAFGAEALPGSLETWRAGRAQRSGAKAAGQAGQREEGAGVEAPGEGASPLPAADPAAQAKRRAARERKVSDGLEALQTFLVDLIRDGLAHAPARPYSDWDTQAARLVDAQAPGAARLVRQIPGHLGDPAALLAHLSRLYLLTEAWPRRDALSGPEQADLRSALGFPLDRAAVLERPGVPARWLVAGQATVQEETLSTRRTWLCAEPHTALLLDFAPPGRPLLPPLPTGQRVQAEVCFAPGAFPQRGVLHGEAPTPAPAPDLPPGVTLDILLDRHGAALALNPWLERSAHVVGPVWLIPGEPWRVQDAGGSLPLGGGERARLTLLAVGGGQPVTLFGEWDGAALLPLSLLSGDVLLPLPAVEEA
ncbi:SWIM zinc finger family protein [Deinococcus koreensis]|uniref:SWIM-type domain-containing protein n=1 Tax=Deinococcus koreensis TaxID=2054903 RepID=A0A2K3V021_9DEIO|nr:SWIM zinc finger family protein [Deinococcus koreensis]PNY82112.1 hypothetical protein CVO96_12690 [Deinococcus koreensis]